MCLPPSIPAIYAQAVGPYPAIVEQGEGVEIAPPLLFPIPCSNDTFLLFVSWNCRGGGGDIIPPKRSGYAPVMHTGPLSYYLLDAYIDACSNIHHLHLSIYAFISHNPPIFFNFLTYIVGIMKTVLTVYII